MPSIPLPRSLIHAWKAWLRVPPPARAAGRRRAVAAETSPEAALDRVGRHVCMLLHGAMTRSAWDYSALAADGLEEVHRIATLLDECDLSTRDRAGCEAYIDAVRALLAEFTRLPAPDRRSA